MQTPDIALVMLLMGVIGTFGYNFTVLLPLIAQYVLHAGPIGFGTLTSAMAIGSLIAAFGIAYSGRVTQRTLLTGAAGFSVLLLCLSLTNIWAVTIAVLVALGFFSIVFTTTANSRLQILTPPQLRGRVMSLYTMLFLGSTPIGSVVLGTLAQHQGVQVAVGEVAVLCGLGTLGGLYYIRRQRIRLALIAGEAENPPPDHRIPRDDRHKTHRGHRESRKSRIALCSLHPLCPLWSRSVSDYPLASYRRSIPRLAWASRSGGWCGGRGG